jgi:hypothetical protein
LTLSASAHHSFVVEYDVKRPLTLKGVVVKIEWTNPHAVLSVEVVDPSGVTTIWSFEMASPNVLERNGWTRRTLSAGDRVTLEGYGGFAIATRGVASSITMADGRSLAAGGGPEAADGAP